MRSVQDLWTKLTSQDRALLRPTLPVVLLGLLLLFNVGVLGFVLWGNFGDSPSARAPATVSASSQTPTSSTAASSTTAAPTAPPPSSTTAAPTSPPPSNTNPPTSPPASTATSAQPPIELRTVDDSAARFETVPLTGSYPGATATRLEVQHRREAGTWTGFPLPTVVGPDGQFSTYVELGELGVHYLRVVDNGAGVASNVITVTIS